MEIHFLNNNKITIDIDNVTKFPNNISFTNDLVNPVNSFEVSESRSKRLRFDEEKDILQHFQWFLARTSFEYIRFLEYIRGHRILDLHHHTGTVANTWVNPALGVKFMFYDKPATLSVIKIALIKEKVFNLILILKKIKKHQQRIRVNPIHFQSGVAMKFSKQVSHSDRSATSVLLFLSKFCCKKFWNWYFCVF